MKVFTGNCPQSVKKNAKYHIRLEKGNYVVGIVYNDSDGSYWTPTTQDHPDLVKMVNDIKLELNGSFGGAFYINEFRQVIVPGGEDGMYYIAGEYTNSLSFVLKDDLCGIEKEISGKAIDDAGMPVAIGSVWSGCLMGIPYIIEAGGKDIRFEKQLSPTHFKKIRLSYVTSIDKAKIFTQRICAAHKTCSQGGRFYINDEREMFKPVTTPNGYVEYIYLGRLEDSDPWFPKEQFMQ